MTDHAAIVALTVDYCWALDTGDWEALRDVFTQDVVAELGAGGQRGIDQVIARVSSALGPLDDSQHMISNHQIEISGDSATCRCYLQAQHVRSLGDDGPGLYMVAGRYEDRCVRTAEGWRIAERRLIPMWRQGDKRVFETGEGQPRDQSAPHQPRR